MSLPASSALSTYLNSFATTSHLVDERVQDRTTTTRSPNTPPRLGQRRHTRSASRVAGGVTTGAQWGVDGDALQQHHRHGQLPRQLWRLAMHLLSGSPRGIAHCASHIGPAACRTCRACPMPIASLSPTLAHHPACHARRHLPVYVVRTTEHVRSPIPSTS